MTTYFGSKLKSLRQEEDMTQVVLSEVTGIKQSLLSNLESGKRFPTLKTVRILSGFFDISESKLTGTESGRPKEIEELFDKLENSSMDVIRKVSSYVDFLVWEEKQKEIGS